VPRLGDQQVAELHDVLLAQVAGERLIDLWRAGVLLRQLLPVEPPLVLEHLVRHRLQELVCDPELIGLGALLRVAVPIDG
jgi:hypothetical protein